MASTAESVHIHYRRLPDRESRFVQRLVHREADCIVTLMTATPLEGPMVVDGRTVLENGSPVVWFTFPGVWHDIGRFHTADGRFTGIYANILTPVRLIDDWTWETTDLFLDVWLSDAGGGVRVLDDDELEAALADGSIAGDLAERARQEANRLSRLAGAGRWPPPIVDEWTLDRALHHSESTAGPD